MQDLRQQFAENPQAAVTSATTEHFNLQTERAATIGEANGRASIFLGSVSAGLIALGFAAQGSSNSGATMLMEMATNSRPARAADAPASATNRLCHSAVE